VADINGDGIPDLVTTGSVLLGNGDGSFQDTVNYAAGGGARSVAVGDFNRDGKLDLAVTVAGGVNVLLGNGDGSFQAALTFSTGYNPSSVAVRDFNSDGWPDLAVANQYSSNVSILLNDGLWGGGAPRSGVLGRAPSRGNLPGPRTPLAFPKPLADPVLGLDPSAAPLPQPEAAGPFGDISRPALRPDADQGEPGVILADNSAPPVPVPTPAGARLGAPPLPLLDRLFAAPEIGWLGDWSPAESG
jgi:hypothetical protein